MFCPGYAADQAAVVDMDAVIPDDTPATESGMDYIIVFRFRSHALMENWLSSDERKQWLRKLQTQDLWTIPFCWIGISGPCAISSVAMTTEE